MAEFLARLKQRKLVQWAIAYVAGAWAVLQLLDLVAQEFGWPGTVMRIITVVLGIGFFVALVLAWYHGERGAQRVGGIELLMLAALLVIAAVAVSWVRYRHAPEPTASVAHTVATPAAITQTRHASAPTAASSVAVLPIAAPPIPPKSVAVLPFENLSADKNNAYFADGIQDLILTKLADIGDLKVIARTSTMQYGSHPQNLTVVGQQLGVATILEGSVQKAGNQVLINVQLINAKTDSHIWAQSYTRTLTNIFGVEGEVAGKVAEALNAKLTEARSGAVAAVPTRNPQAYDDYLRGQHFADEAAGGAWSTYIPKAIAYYQKAVAADPGFALAWASLSNARLNARYWYGDRSVENLDAADKAARRALELAPNLANAHTAMAGVYRFKYHDIKAAHAEALRAVQLRPNDADALSTLGVLDGHLGDSAAAIKAVEKAAALSPRESFYTFQVGLFRGLAGDYPGARRALTRALAINPQDAQAYVAMSWIDVASTGDVEAALGVLDHMAAGTPSTAAMARQRIELALARRDFSAARAQAAALDTTGADALGNIFLQAKVAWLTGQRDTARRLYTKIVESLKQDSSATNLADLAGLAVAYARLDHANEANAADRRAEAFARRANEIGGEFRVLESRAKAELALGHKSAAIDALVKALALPGHGLELTPALLRLDPVWDPIRHDPRFQALLKKYANSVPAAASIRAYASTCGGQCPPYGK